MGQFITKSDTNSDIASVAMSAAGFMGIFGTGNFQVFYSGTSNFVVPPNISRLRVRVIGGGGAGATAAAGGGTAAAGGGGAGGGYAHAIYAVTPSTSYVVTVATVGPNTTQFGSRISVTGRNATIAAQPAPEVGSSYTCDGGFGTSPINPGGGGGGGGGAGQQIGVLGTGGMGIDMGGQSAFSRVWNNRIGAPNGDCSATDGTNSNLYIPARFPFDTFTGGGGGAGTASAGGAGGAGGGGGATAASRGTGGAGGIGGGGGGGGGAASSTAGIGGAGGPGLVIVEW